MAKSIYRDEYVTLLRTIREVRTKAGFTQAQCAAALGRPQSFVSDVERGSRRLDLVQLRDFCRVTGTTLGAFITKFEKELASEENQRSKKKKRK
jgi:transcriptional regulator with XRE-family HTH domain